MHLLFAYEELIINLHLLAIGSGVSVVSGKMQYIAIIYLYVKICLHYIMHYFFKPYLADV